MLPEIQGDEFHLYWQSVVNTMAEGLFIVDTQGIIVFMNPAAEAITGYEQRDVMGRSCTLFESETCLACTGPDGRLSCGLFDKGRVKNKQCTLKRKDGSVVHLLKNAVVLQDEHGQVIGGVETLSDVTDLIEKDRQITGLRKQLKNAFDFEGLVGSSLAMQRVYQLLEAAAASTAPVVILGESGTGKELAAAAVHRRSPRKGGPFVKVNCAALNESVLESELFGHEKGAFTGADRQRQGRFEAAHGGSLFLDEIGDLPPSVQVKLLRVLQEGEIERVGSNQPIPVDVRIITATNRDLDQLVAGGSFRNDLYYRINVVPITLPALRQRPDDIPLLTQAFVERISLRSGKPIKGLSRAALDRLMAYHWPGNVRELLNALEYAFVVCRREAIQASDLPPQIAMGRDGGRACDIGAPGAALPAIQEGSRDAVMRREVEEALAASGGRKAKAAELLGVSRVTLWKRMKKLGMG